MKLLVVAAVLAVCGGAKLDRTYLPPAGAKSAGGTDLQTPLDAPAAPGLPARSAFDGVAVEAAGPGAPLARLSSGLGAPAAAYGSANTRVGEAAFRGASQQAPAAYQHAAGAGQTSNGAPQPNFNGVPQQSTYRTPQQSYNGAPQQNFNGAAQQSSNKTPQQSYNGFTHQSFDGAPSQSNAGTPQGGSNAANHELGNTGAPQQSYNGALQQGSTGPSLTGDSPRFGQQFGADINAKPFGQPEPARPQASQERAAGIVRLDSDVTAEGFAYRFETDNGIAAEENALAANGVQAQGAFSYRGDDGETYSVSYTADENGYRPQGAHLPTPPPIPDDILRSIEQNMRDEAAGIVDEGVYDAQKYGGGQYESAEGAAGFGGQSAQYNQNGASIGSAGQFAAASQQAKQAMGSYLPPQGSRPIESSSQQYTNNGRQGSSSQYQHRTASPASQFTAQQFNPAPSQGPSQKYSSPSQHGILQQYTPNTQGAFQQPDSPQNQGSFQQYQGTSQQRYTPQSNVPKSQESSQQPDYPTAQGPFQHSNVLPGQLNSATTQQSHSQKFNNQGPSQQPNYPSTQELSQQPNVYKPQGQFNSGLNQQSNSQQHNSPSNQKPTQKSSFPKFQSPSQQFNQQYNAPAQTSAHQGSSQQYNTPTNQYSTQSHSQQFTSQPLQSSAFSQFSKAQTQQYTFPSSAQAQISGQASSLPQPIADISESSQFNSPAHNANQQSQKFTASSSFSQFKPNSQLASQDNAYQYNPPAKSFSTPQQLNPQNNPQSLFQQYNTAPQGASSQSYNPRNQKNSQQYNAPSGLSQTTTSNHASKFNGPSSQNLQQQTGSSQPTSSTFGQPQGSQSSPIEEPSTPSQQYDGEIYQYNKPEDTSSPARPQTQQSTGGQTSSQFGAAPQVPSQGTSQKYTAQSQHGGGGGSGTAPGTDAVKEQFGGPRAPPSFNAQTGYQY